MKKKRRPQKNIFLPLFLGALVVAGYLAGVSPASPFSRGEKVVGNAGADERIYENVLVRRVVDGDTLKLETGEYVRLLGIDTPEMHESSKLYRDAARSGMDVSEIRDLGRRSYDFTRDMAEGRRVRLEFDQERYDKYNRLLAYVFLEDGTFLNGRIVEEGYASITHYKTNTKYADLFLRLYRQARENKRGLWQ